MHHKILKPRKATRKLIIMTVAVKQAQSFPLHLPVEGKTHKLYQQLRKMKMGFELLALLFYNETVFNVLYVWYGFVINPYY